MNPKYIQIAVLASVFALQYFFEHVFPQKKQFNNRNNERFNILIGIVNIVITLVPGYFFVKWLGFLDEYKLGVFHQVSSHHFLTLLLTIFILDLWMYTWHRMNHRVRWLWHFHQFHHRDEMMNSSLFFVELLLAYLPRAFVCLIFGISYFPFMVYEILFTCSVIIHHSNMKITLRFDRNFRILFASPMMHRIHHSKQWEESNSNFGGLFSFWDRLFSTHLNSNKEDIEFGIE